MIAPRGISLLYEVKMSYVLITLISKSTHAFDELTVKALLSSHSQFCRINNSPLPDYIYIGTKHVISNDQEDIKTMSGKVSHNNGADSEQKTSSQVPGCISITNKCLVFKILKFDSQTSQS